MHAVVMVMLAGAVADAGAPAAPEMAVFALQARNGVSLDVAAMVTDHVVDVLRRNRSLGRVTSWPELQTLLSLEQAKQLADCGGDSCIAEVMGALNVEYVVLGSVGKLGRHLLVSLQMLQVRTSTAVATVTVRVCADDEGLLLPAIEPSVKNMLVEGRLLRGRVAALPPSITECPDSPMQGVVPTETATEDGSFRRRVTFLGAGTGVLVSLTGLLVGTTGWALAGASLAYLAALQTPRLLGQIPTGNLTNTSRLAVLYGVEVGGAVTSLVAVVGGAVALAAGLTGLLVLFIFRS